jgi:hypothetical protein
VLDIDRPFAGCPVNYIDSFAAAGKEVDHAVIKIASHRVEAAYSLVFRIAAAGFYYLVHISIEIYARLMKCRLESVHMLCDKGFDPVILRSELSLTQTYLHIRSLLVTVENLIPSLTENSISDRLEFLVSAEIVDAGIRIFEVGIDKVNPYKIFTDVLDVQRSLAGLFCDPSVDYVERLVKSHTDPDKRFSLSREFEVEAYAVFVVCRAGVFTYVLKRDACFSDELVKRSLPASQFVCCSDVFSTHFSKKSSAFCIE